MKPCSIGMIESSWISCSISCISAADVAFCNNISWWWMCLFMPGKVSRFSEKLRLIIKVSSQIKALIENEINLFENRYIMLHTINNCFLNAIIAAARTGNINKESCPMILSHTCSTWSTARWPTNPEAIQGKAKVKGLNSKRIIKKYSDGSDSWSKSSNSLHKSSSAKDTSK